MGGLIEIIAPVFIVVAMGYLAVWHKIMPENGPGILMRFAQGIAVPALLFRAIGGLDLSTDFDLRLLTSFYTGAISCFFLGMMGAHYLFKRDWQDSVAIGFCALFSNSVLLGLPITERAFGVEVLQAANFAIIAVHAPICYGVGITAMEIIRNRGQGPARTALAVLRGMFRNPLMIGISLGFIANFTGLVLPGTFEAALDMVIRTALPTALFALGGTLFFLRPEGDLKEVLWVCLLSLFVHPSIAYGMTTMVFDLPQNMVRGAVLTAAMAPGVNTYLFANLYGRAKRVAATSVLVATAAAVLSVTFWLGVLGA